MSDNKVRVLVVDDTIIYRKIIRDVLDEHPGIEVVGTASNGKIALERIADLHPDVLTLDIEMPVMNGLDVLRALQKQHNRVGAIVLSALTSDAAKSTVDALKLGAFDFVLKPSGGTLAENAGVLRESLCSKIMALGRTLAIRRILNGSSDGDDPTHELDSEPESTITQQVKQVAFAPTSRPRIVALGISTGGPQALTRMLPQLPGDMPVPVVIVQHMPPVFTKSLADDLDRRCGLSVREATDRQRLVAGDVLIAPGGRQMRLVEESGNVQVRLTDDPPVNNCRPSVDYLFQSIAQIYGADAVGVIMTGMGDDGTEGCRQMKKRGAAILAQDEASCVVFGMPRKPISEGIADVVAPLDQIASQIVGLVKKGQPACV